MLRTSPTLILLISCAVSGLSPITPRASFSISLTDAAVLSVCTGA